MNFSYEDIIHLSAPISKKHSKMSLYNRAAQFAPFAALTGHESSIAETRRQTDKKMELDNDAMEELLFKLSFLLLSDEREPLVTITHFIPDKNKEGGEYCTITGQIKKYNEINQILTLSNNQELLIQNILNIDSPLLNSFL